MESTLLETGHFGTVEISRNIVMKTILQQLTAIIELEFDQEVESFYHDWNYPQNTGMITIQFRASVTHQLNQDQTEPNNFKPLIDEIDRISILVQKKPEKTEACFISPKICLVKREGILIQIEKKLIEKGYEQNLMVAKDDLEKSYLHRDNRFEEIFRNPIADVFVDWDFSEDRSIICFVLK
jgi:uncharacterized protein YbcI